MHLFVDVTAPTSICSRITTTHELTQAEPPRLQIGSWCSALTIQLFIIAMGWYFWGGDKILLPGCGPDHCRVIGVLGVLLRWMLLPACESVGLSLLWMTKQSMISPLLRLREILTSLHQPLPAAG
jgi:hypothetical protein